MEFKICGCFFCGLSAMLSDLRIQQFIKAVKIDLGEELSFEDASKILTGITGYLLTLEKIYIRMQNKNNNQKNEPKS